MMTLQEAMTIAYEGEHATVTYDLAATVIRSEGSGRDQMAYAQLAEHKAAMQRWTSNKEIRDAILYMGREK